MKIAQKLVAASVIAAIVVVAKFAFEHGKKKGAKNIVDSIFKKIEDLDMGENTGCDEDCLGGWLDEG